MFDIFSPWCLYTLQKLLEGNFSHPLLLDPTLALKLRKDLGELPDDLVSCQGGWHGVRVLELGRAGSCWQCDLPELVPLWESEGPCCIIIPAAHVVGSSMPSTYHQFAFVYNIPVASPQLNSVLITKPIFQMRKLRLRVSITWITFILWKFFTNLF